MIIHNTNLFAPLQNPMPVSQKLSTAAPTDLKHKTNIRSQGSQVAARKQQLADEQKAKRRKTDLVAKFRKEKPASIPAVTDRGASAVSAAAGAAGEVHEDPSSGSMMLLEDDDDY